MRPRGSPARNCQQRQALEFTALSGTSKALYFLKMVHQRGGTCCCDGISITRCLTDLGELKICIPPIVMSKKTMGFGEVAMSACFYIS